MIHLVVGGRVQGVGYRWFIREAARRLALGGWVRNREDGTVEIAASGETRALQALVDAARRGPPGAHVASVAELPTEGLGSLEPPFTTQR